MEEYCFQPKQSKLPVMSKDTYHSFLLAMGGIVDSLNKYGEREQAHKIIDKIHDMIGLHGRSLPLLPYFFGYKTDFFPSKTIPKI